MARASYSVSARAMAPSTPNLAGFCAATWPVFTPPLTRGKYKTREEARRDVFDYIEFFYNPQRKHVRNGMLSPIAFEQLQKLKLQGV
ncbi:integrase catalytic subunit [Rhodovulum sulfidophilum]|uniref:Integrase catalytic subunit n=1 Tax=Rhodovulum sulfidophilum TaxID=35806 RepID=A0A0D6B6P5_RHOSU|nr:integrase catalytic subunit [Rhodovulum sulfidophilum]